MKRLSVIITAIAVLLCSCFVAGADTVYRYGDWTLSAITGDDDIAFCVRTYEGTDTTVTVPYDYGGYPIIAVKSYTFAANKTVREVILHDRIRVIGEGAFLAASALEKVTLTSSVTSIGDSAFSNAQSLKDVNLAESSVESIGKNTFLKSGIEEIYLPDTCSAVGDNAFAHCDKLTKIGIPDSVTTISDSAFQGSDSIVIYGSSDSYAIAYAKAHGISYVCTDAEAYVLGDADGNGDIEILDVTVVQRVVADIPVADSDSAARNGDVDGSGLNITDATWIQRYLVSIATPYEIGTLVTVNN